MMRKPKVVILGTGGTIAGRAGSNTEMTGYQAGEIGIQTLINAVPEMLEVADVTGEQFCNIGSFDMIDDIWLRSSRRVSELLHSRKSMVLLLHMVQIRWKKQHIF